MKRLQKGILVVLGLGVLIVASAGALLLWEFRVREVTLPAPGGPSLSEDQAVTLAREALEKIGEDPSRFAPRAYDGTRFFARNAQDPTRGYVLWASEDSHPGFSVRLERTDAGIRCGVSRCK